MLAADYAAFRHAFLEEQMRRQISPRGAAIAISCRRFAAVCRDAERYFHAAAARLRCHDGHAVAPPAMPLFFSRFRYSAAERR